MWNKSKIDLEQLAEELRDMSVRSKLYKVVKVELSKRNWWKPKPRGKPNYNFKNKVDK
jgi:hypothetical protein